MGQKRAYRALTEAEKQYIDRLVNETFGEFVGNMTNGIKNAYGQFHDNMWGKNQNQTKKQQNPTQQDYVNMSPWELNMRMRNGEDKQPTERTQWAQFNDWLADIATNGKHSQKKNAYLNQMMRNDMQMGNNISYWEAKLLNYWGFKYKKKVDGETAANDFLTWMRNVSHNGNYNNEYLSEYIRYMYGNQPINYNTYGRCVAQFGKYAKNKQVDNSPQGFVKLLRWYRKFGNR